MKKYLILSLLLLVPAFASALTTDRGQPIQIESNTADIDNKQGISVYQGDVVITQGTTRITGDKVTVYTAHQKIQKIIAEGVKDRAYYEEEQPNNKGMLKAWGYIIDYDVTINRVQLIKQAKLAQQGDVFKGDHIDYDLNKQTVSAKGTTQKQGSNSRVQMVIQPKTDNSQNELSE